MNSPLLISLLMSAVSAGVGAFFGSYFKKKGELRALKEDFADIKSQLRESTKLTESIKTRIGGDFWLAQERWKLKKELYQSLLATLDEACDTVRTLDDQSMSDQQKTERRVRLEAEIRKAKATAHLVSRRAVEIVSKIEQMDVDFEHVDENSVLDFILGVYEKAYADLAEASHADLILDMAQTEG